MTLKYDNWKPIKCDLEKLIFVSLIGPRMVFCGVNDGKIQHVKSVPIFYGVSLSIQSECRKMREKCGSE